MYLFVDPSEKDQIHLALFDEDRFFEKKTEVSNRELLASIDAFFGEENINKKDLRGVMVVVGAGGFTSTRIAVTVVNTFGYVLQIPLLAITKDQSSNIQDLIPELNKQPKGQYISATYSAEPSISKSNK